MTLSLARRYRPKRFAEVAVQSHVSNTLQGAIARGRVAHGYLLCGPRGVGKTTLARVLAMALNCERRGAPGVPPGEPCGECASCSRIWSGAASLDVVEIDAASNRGVDDARDLRERAMYAPSEASHHKVYIVDEAHMLTREAWNALLKILEEPPPRVVFVFATTEPQKIAQSAAPVLSRLQRFDLKRIGAADVRERLTAVLHAEQVAAEPEALALLARAADGSMRDALSLTDQALALGEGKLTAVRVREALGLVPEDEYLAMLDIIASRRGADIFPAVARLVDAGVDLGSFLTGIADMLRAQLAITLGGSLPELSEKARSALASGASRFAAADILRMLAAIGELEPRFRRSGQQQLLLEALLVRFALLDRTVELEMVLRQLGGEGSSEPGGGDARSRPERQGAPTPHAPAPRRASAPTPNHVRPIVGDAPAIDTAAADEDEPPPPTMPPEPLTLAELTARWDDVVTRVREVGRSLLAASLVHATPVSVSPRGEIVLELDAANAVHEQGIARGAADILAAIGALFSGATRVDARLAASTGPAAAPKRLTAEAVKGERLASLRKRDAALDAAVEALDLELLE